MTMQGPTVDSDGSIKPIFQPYFKPDYKLFYGSQNYFVFFRQIYTIYERLIKAKQIVSVKVEEELAEKQDDNLTARQAEFKQERYELLIGGVINAINQTIDANKYEDFARTVLGNKAYLLFAFDKLVISVILLIANREHLGNQAITQHCK